MSAHHKPLHGAGQTADFLYKPVGNHAHKEDAEAQSNILYYLCPRLTKDNPRCQGNEKDDARQYVEDSASEAREEDASPFDKHDRQHDGKEDDFQQQLQQEHGHALLNSR